MQSQTQLILVIEKIIKLLTSVEEKNWVNIFKTYRNRCESKNEKELVQLRNDIVRIYGGMGTFNDLVLYKQTQPAVKENQKLDELRKNLFFLLHEK